MSSSSDPDLLTTFPDFSSPRSPDAGADPFAHLVEAPPLSLRDQAAALPLALPPKPAKLERKEVKETLWQCAACTFAENKLVRASESARCRSIVCADGLQARFAAADLRSVRHDDAFTEARHGYGCL
jgi:hypothetical protein